MKGVALAALSLVVCACASCHTAGSEGTKTAQPNDEPDGVTAVIYAPTQPAEAPTEGPAEAPLATWKPTVVPLAVHGLSGLDSDGDLLWSVAERDSALVALHPTGLSPKVVPIDAVPAGYDLESLAVIRPGRMALGTETSAEVWASDEGQRAAKIFLVEVGDARAKVTGNLELPFALWGVKPAENQGVEGLCVAGHQILAGIETVLTEDDHRYAPLAWRPIDGGGWHPVLLQLTSDQGKLSALDCHRGANGIDVLAVERHFDVMRILRFTLPDGMVTTAVPKVVVVPEIVADFTKETTKDHINIEGIATTKAGIALINDNQYTSITGPTELFRLPVP